MDKEKVKKELIRIFWVYIIGCVFGYFLEMLVVLFKKGYFESRQGLIYGPFIPVYGIGAVIYYIFFKFVKTQDKLKAFLYTMVLGGFVEFMCSYVQEKVFGTISWDYSNLPFNIQGRTSLLHCTYWGLAGLLYVMYVEPFLVRLESVLFTKKAKIITFISVVFMSFDIIISTMAGIRQNERAHSIPADSNLDRIIDVYYNDDVMNRIYTNKKEVI